MITVRYLGISSFLITTSKKTTILLDPYSDFVPYNFPTVSADIVVISHEHRAHNAVWRIGGNPKIVKRTSDFEMEQEVPIQKTGETFVFHGIPSAHDKFSGRQRGPNTIFCFEIEGINFCHLGDLGHLLSEEQRRKIGKVNVLFIPVGGRTTISPTEAVLTINQLNPGIVFPMHYLTPGIMGLNLADEELKSFAEKMENVRDESTTAINLELAKLPEKTEVVLLKFE
ncbi:MAG: MBL fold metallo-hydrolase [Candidatus Eremiobacteraeota bacterium]|nr:MBL fold metallo-hydrolase [Candidatus Eremiobacteraeota bacterium]